MKFVRTNLGLILIILFAFALRLYHAGTYGLYLDEKYTLIISQGVVMEGSNQVDVFFTPGKTYFTPEEFWKEKSMSDFIAANIRGDIGNSPGYYAVLWVWIKFFGLSDLSIRFPSILFSTLLVWLAFVFVRRWFKSDWLAYVTALLVAVEPFFIAYSHMARNYSMSFFLTFFATHLFLLSLNRMQNGKSAWKLLLIYGFTFVMALLSHYLTITVFLCHGIYALLFVRPVQRWVPYLLTGVVGIALVSLWFVFGGGTYTFKTLAYQAEFYRNLALTDPYHNGFGIILPATIPNVIDRSLPIWADLFMFSNGLGQTDNLGYRYLALALISGIIAVYLFHRYYKSETVPTWVFISYSLLLIAALPFAQVISLQYVVVAALPSFLYLLVLAIRNQVVEGRLNLMVFICLLAVVPTLFLLVMSFKSGHTYGITQRYSGFSFPYTCILVALMIRQCFQLANRFQYILLAVLLLQFYFVVQLLNRVYQDKTPKYTYFGEQRGPNPYYLTAQKIKQLYTPGDTVLYPSERLHPRDEIEKTYWPYSIKDAQLTNLYLPRDAKYLQRMDTTEVDKIVLLKKTGQKIVLFDLDGPKHRY